MLQTRALLAALGVMAALIFAIMPAAAGPAPQEAQDAPRIRDAIAGAIDPDPKRINPDSQDQIRRLPRVTIDSAGDLTVVFALRDEGTKESIVATGLADTLAIFRAAYQSAPDQVTTATVVGTYGLARPESNVTRERRVLLATLSGDRAAQLDWATLAPEQLPAAVNFWWLYPPFQTS